MHEQRMALLDMIVTEHLIAHQSCGMLDIIAAKHFIAFDCGSIHVALRM
jgi:hypothetical protein